MATYERFEHPKSFISYHDVLETYGITKDLAQKRIEVYRNVAVNNTIFRRRVTGENIEIIIPGSRGEGTAGYLFDSDVDVLFVQRSVKCFKTFPNVNKEESCLISFLLDFEDLKSGYAMLRLISTGHTRTDTELLRNIEDGLVRRNGYKYLRNDNLFTSVLDYHSERLTGTRAPALLVDKTGPASSFVFDVPCSGGLSIDRVLAFPISFPSVLDSWRKRDRKCNWPSIDLIDKASRQNVFVVPVGVNGSENESLQWRISVTMAEQALVHSFNDTQIKLYAAVKMIVKQELKPVCENMSSYVVKNVLFWVIEGTEVEYFKREYFNDRLLDILKHLRRCVYWRYLPNYMFQSSNMLYTKILGKERQELIRRLDEMIDNCGSSVLRRLPLVRDMIHMPKEIFQKKIIFKQLREQAALATFSIPPSQFEKLMKDKVIHKNTIYMKLEKLLFVSKHVLSIIRSMNPYDYFNLLISMTDEEIFYRLNEGVWLGFHKS